MTRTITTLLALAAATPALAGHDISRPLPPRGDWHVVQRHFTVPGPRCYVVGHADDATAFAVPTATVSRDSRSNPDRVGVAFGLVAHGEPEFPDPSPDPDGEVAPLLRAQVFRDGTEVASHLAGDGRFVVVDDVRAFRGGREAYANLYLDGTPRQYVRVGFFLAGLDEALDDYARRCPPERRRPVTR